MTTVVNEAVIQFTEAKIELYEIIEVMSVLSREHLTLEVEMRDVATLMELMTKTISSARCVVEFLKVMSSPLPTFGLPAKQQDENENPLLPSSGSFGISSEVPKSKDLPAISSTPSTQSEAITASPPASARNEGRYKDACFASPGDSPELVISGHIRHLGGSVDCTPMSSPREEQDEDEQEDLSMLQAQAAENWTAWRSEGYKSGLDKLKEKFSRSDSKILEVTAGDHSGMDESSQAIQSPSHEAKAVDPLAISFQDVREKFENLSGSRIEDLSANELEELIGELSKVEEENLEKVKKRLMVRKGLVKDETIQEVASLKPEGGMLLGEKEAEEASKAPGESVTSDASTYETALTCLRLKFKDLSGTKVEELQQDQAEELISDLRLLQEEMIKEKKDSQMAKSGNQQEEKFCANVKVEPQEAVNSTLAPQSMPPPPAPHGLSPIRTKLKKDVSSVMEPGLNSCLRGSRGFPLVNNCISWKEEASIHYFPRIQGWASVPKEGGATLGMAAKHCLWETVRLREEEDVNLSGRISPPDIPPVVDQFANRGLKKSTRCSSRLSMSASSLSSCSSSSSAYSSASSSCLQPSLMEEEESFCPPPSAPPPLSKSGKSTKKATRSSVRLSVAPCPQEEWRSLPTKPGVLKLSRLPATEASSPSLNSSDSSMSCSTSLNSSRGGKGELGTRGLSKVGSRARKQLLKQAGLEVDPAEADELRQLRISRSRTNCGCDCEGQCGQECPCIQGGISCHEEEPGEPCACNDTQCGNPFGRYRFDQTLVEMHFAEVKMGIVSLG